MEILESVIMLISLVLVSNILDHFIPAIPVSLIQVGLGLIMALAFKTTIPLETDWFLLLFVAPLLFNDGRRFPKKELWKLRGPIMANAIWLVFLTTIVGGFAFHLLMPAMPLAVCIALAAILSPTDPVAVQSISQRVDLPENVLHLVSGESLINDASGLIAFKYAIAATVSGTFVLSKAALDFTYISLVGFAVGAVLMIAILLLEEWLYRHGINDVIFITVLQITTPFVIYLLTEELTHASGVIAVVTAGIISHIYDGGIKNQPELTLVREKTWDIIIYTLNGIVFLILGVELPLATTKLIVDDQISTLGALGISFLVWVILLLIRVLWIFIYQVANRSKKQEFSTKTVRYSFKMAILAGLSGVRGAVTMAGVLSVPLVINSGAAFPARSLMLFVAAGVIIISLVAATITLPLVSASKGPIVTRALAASRNANFGETNEQPASAEKISEDEARIYIMKMAIQKIEEERREENSREVFELILDYQFLIRNLELKLQDTDAMNKVLADELALRRVALAGEREALEKLHSENSISDKTYAFANRRLAHQETQLQHSYIAHANHRGSDIVYWLKRAKKWLAVRFYQSKETDVEMAEFSLAQREQAKAAIQSLSQYLARDDIAQQRFESQSVYHLIVRYRNQIERAGNSNEQFQAERDERQYQNLRVRGLAAEREGVQILLEQGHIDWSLATKLRQYINYSETVLITDNGEDESN
ncbi:cation:proton antiporter [Lentilactobacillus senioris]|nr:sodium:proton antiporter [Lentilactobacillus senioris]